MEYDPMDENNDGSLSVNSPFFSSNDPTVVKHAVEAELSKTENERNRHLAEASKAVKNSSATHDNNWGHTVENDPIHGAVDDPDDVNKYANEFIDDMEKSESLPLRKIEATPATVDNVETKNIETNNPETLPSNERLENLFDDFNYVRSRVKDPGNPSYRIISVAAADLKRINQPSEPAERVKTINNELEEASKAALGGQDLNEYEKDVVAAAQLYLGEILIGDDADSVSIGATETIVNPTGQVGKNPDVYNNLVVTRWTKDGINNVFVFSPKKHSAIYTLVDDSMGDSWRKKFLMAGAIDGSDRDEISSIRHRHSDSFFHHEVPFEMAASNILLRQRSVLAANEILNEEDKKKVNNSILEKFSKLAHVSLGDKMEPIPSSHLINRKTDGINKKII